MCLRKGYFLLLPLLCLLFSGCGLQDYPTYTYELKNGLGENYLINYCEQTDYPENITRVKVFREKEKISDYNGGAYSGCDSYIPSQMMFICSSDKVDYYYLRTQSGEYIVADGVADLKMEFNMMLLGKAAADMSEQEKNTYQKLSETVKNAVTADSIQNKFSDCGYNSSVFMTFYNYNT